MLQVRTTWSTFSLSPVHSDLFSDYFSSPSGPHFVISSKYLPHFNQSPRLFAVERMGPIGHLDGPISHPPLTSSRYYAACWADVAADGRLGYPELAPFDAIHVGAAAAELPQPLVQQLKPGGRMVIPVGKTFQELKVVDKRVDGSVAIFTETSVRYVPLTSRDAQLQGAWTPGRPAIAAPLVLHTAAALFSFLYICIMIWVGSFAVIPDLSSIDCQNKQNAGDLHHPRASMGSRRPDPILGSCSLGRSLR